MSNTSICILIMCTNESHIIKETLETTLPYATDYIICDNASTDNTVQICQDFFNEHQIKGQIFHYHWVNFGHNYSYLYNLAYKHTQSQYWFQIDADDLIHGHLDLNNLTKDKYHLKFGDEGDISYTRPQIFKNDIKWVHRLKIHGYIDTESKGTPHITSDTIYGDYYIASRRLGNRHKIDYKTKYLNDAKMLQEDINNPTIDDVDKSRCYFYLGQSYLCAGEYKKSIQAYEKRISKGYWKEEIFYSKYQIGQCYKFLAYGTGENLTIINDTYYKKALDYYEDSWKYRPTRSEGLYQAARLCRICGDYKKAYQYVLKGKNIKIPNDTLFVMTEGYLWGFDFELTIICYCINKNNEGLKACQRLLVNKNLPDDMKTRVEENYKFYEL